MNFVTNTLPKPVLVALLYRLSILHLASHILPTIGADSWESEDGVDDGWDGRPVNTSLIILTYFFLTGGLLDVHLYAHSLHIQAINSSYGVFASFMCVVSLIPVLSPVSSDVPLVLDHSSQIWWRWMNIFFTLIIWTIELLVSGDGEDDSPKWKID